MKQPTVFTVAPDSRLYVVVIVKKVETITVSSKEEAENIADTYRALGLEVTIYQEWDLQEVPQPQLLLPLEASKPTTPNVPNP